MIVGPVQVQVGGQQWQWYCWQTSVDQYRNIVDILVLNQLVFCAGTIIQTFVFLKCQSVKNNITEEQKYSRYLSVDSNVKIF